MSCNSEGEVHLLDEYFEKSDDGTVFYLSIHISLLVYRGWQFCITWFYLFLSAHRPQVIINLNSTKKRASRASALRADGLHLRVDF